MCWEIKDVKQLTPQISDGKVQILKVCKLYNGSIHGYYYRDFIYELNKEYETEINMKSYPFYHYAGYEGFHCYDADVYIQVTRYDVAVYDRTRFITAYDNFSCVVVRGYIPKGATYYINHNKEIITNKIVLTEIVKKGSNMC